MDLILGTVIFNKPQYNTIQSCKDKSSAWTKEMPQGHDGVAKQQVLYFYMDWFHYQWKGEKLNPAH